jgi:hypothetical protein
MLIQEKPLHHWMENFYGYGSWKAKLWFVAHEEGGGDTPEEVAEKINYFHNVYLEGKPILCDIRELYRHVAFPFEGPKSEVYSNLYEYRFENNAVLHGVWKNIIGFVQGYKNLDITDLLSYQQNDFVSSSTNIEALLRLYPLPAPHNHGWYYSWLDMPQFPFLKSRQLYQDHVYAQRIGTVLRNISAHKPEVVLMYGMNNINSLKQSIQEFYPAVKFKMVKAIKRQIPQHHRAEIDGTILLITTQIPALRHNRIETGFDWNALGKMVASS